MPNLSDIDKQIAELEAQKRQLIESERKAAIKKAEDAIAELNALGFNYVLADNTKAPTKRRTGVREKVRKAVANAADGIAPAAIAEQLDMTDKAGKQSIANALSALKKSKAVTADNGIYRAV